MKKTIFLVHDPGGYHAIYPLVQRYQAEGLGMEFYCAGPSGVLNPTYYVDETEIIRRLQSHISTPTLQLLVTGTSWGTQLEVSAIRLCQEAGIQTVAVLDYWSHYRMRFMVSSQNLPVYPDYYIVMDELAKQEARLEGVPEHILRVLGHPGLDGVIQSRRPQQRTSPTPSPTPRRLLFLSQPLSQLYGDNLGYDEGRVIRDCMQAVRLNRTWILKIRFHTKDQESLKQLYANFAVSNAQSLGEMLTDYDVVIGMNSFGLLHAVLLGIPTISYQPNLKQPDVCITNKLGLTKVITHYEDLVLELNKFSESGKWNGSNEGEHALDSLQRLTAYTWSDGQSSQRIFAFLREVTAHGKH